MAANPSGTGKPIPPESIPPESTPRKSGTVPKPSPEASGKPSPAVQTASGSTAAPSKAISSTLPNKTTPAITVPGKAPPATPVATVAAKSTPAAAAPARSKQVVAVPTKPTPVAPGLAKSPPAVTVPAKSPSAATPSSKPTSGAPTPTKPTTTAVVSGKPTSAGAVSVKSATAEVAKGIAANKDGGISGLNNLKKVGRYDIIKKIGQGGMGAVFLANDTQLKRQVALKVLPREKAENPILVKRFKAEAQAAAQLKHENIVAVHDAGEADGLLYIALEFIDGTDAHTLIAKRGPLPATRAMDVIRQVTLALQHAHEQKIVHRDIKPSNLLLRKDGLVKLTDMGLARSVDESMETNITRAGTTVGTVDYMSPEQARNSKAADVRSDMYSLGATWFHLLAGHPPFAEGSMLNKLNAHAAKARPDVRDETASVPENVSVMIKRMMAIDPADRYQTPAELLADLDNEYLTRGPTSLKDLAALAHHDDDDEEEGHKPKRPVPKATYKKPESQESQQLMAPTVEVPVMPAQPVAEEKPKQEINFGSLKGVMIVVGIVVAVAGLGWLTSNYGGVVATPTNPGQNPFDRETGANSNNAPSVVTNDTPTETTGAEKSTGPKPLTPDSKRSPQPLTPITTGSKNTDSQDGRPTAASPAGSLYLPPISPLGREGEVRFVPKWVTASGSPAKSSLNSTGVGGGPNGFDDVPTLEEALTKVPVVGGIVELITDGPYFLGPLQLLNRATVVIRAANGARPVLVMVAEADQPYDSLLQLTNGALTLEGLQVVIFARQFATGDPLTLFSVRGGDLAAVNCSFTLLGTRPGKTFALGAEGKVIRSDPKESSRGRILVRDCVVRGASLGAFHVDQAATDLIASRCVFATGSAPVLSLTNHEQPDNEPAPPTLRTIGGSSKSPASKGPLNPAAGQSATGSTSRSVRFLSCSMLSQGTAFELAAGAGVGKPPLTEVSVINSVVAGGAGTKSVPVLLALPGWPQNPLPKPAENGYENLQWTIESSLVCGWQKLILEEPGTTAVVRTGADWKREWRTQPTLDESQFQASGWPKKPLTELSTATGGDFVIPADIGIKGTDGQSPGWPVGEFPDSAGLTLARADALADRMRYPVPGWEPFAANKTIQVDANTQDLGRVLASEKWPNGTLVIVSGSGGAQMTPVEVKGKSLRIEFKQQGDTPLVLSPRKSSKSGDDEAMFIVEGGSLEIIGGQFRFPNSSSEPLPQFFLSVFDGDFALRRCQVLGQTLDGTSKFLGLIHWKRSEVEPKDRSQPAERNSGLIVDSALLTTGRLLDADMRNRTLLLRNSLFASIGDLFDLNINGFDSRLNGTLDARWCTFGAGGKFLFQVRGTKGAEKTTRPLHVFLENCALLSLNELSGATNTPVLLSARDYVVANQQLAWWDQSNGYSAPWTQLIRPADTPPKDPQSFDRDWNNQWGVEHVIRPLVTSGGVRLGNKLPHRSKVSPYDFTLANDCQAATWGPNQTSLGVDFARWNSASSPNRPVPNNTRPDPNKPSVKKSDSTKGPKPVKPGF